MKDGTLAVRHLSGSPDRGDQVRSVNFAAESRRVLREQIISDLGRIQERIELSAADCGLDSGWFLKVYQTVNSLILLG